MTEPVACFLVTDPSIPAAVEDIISGACPDVAAIIVGEFGIGYTAGLASRSFLVHQIDCGYTFPYRSGGVAMSWSPVDALTEHEFRPSLLGLRALCLLSAVTDACQKPGAPRLLMEHVDDDGSFYAEMEAVRGETQREPQQEPALEGARLGAAHAVPRPAGRRHEGSRP